MGKGLKAVGSSPQEFRPCREVPITLLRMDVPKVDRSVGEYGLHVHPLLIPALHPGHREGMAQRGQAGGALTMGGRDSYALAQPRKPVVQGTMPQIRPLFGDEKGLRYSVVV